MSATVIFRQIKRRKFLDVQTKRRLVFCIFDHRLRLNHTTNCALIVKLLDSNSEHYGKVEPPSDVNRLKKPLCGDEVNQARAVGPSKSSRH